MYMIELIMSLTMIIKVIEILYKIIIYISHSLFKKKN